MIANKLKIKEYSILAGIILFNNKIDIAQVVYKDLDPDVDVDSHFGAKFLDIDNNLNADFKVTKYSTIYATDYSNLYYSTQFIKIGALIPGNSIVGLKNEIGTDFVDPLNYGDPIAWTNFVADSNQLFSIVRQQITSNYLDPIGPLFYNGFGGWQESFGDDKFVGIKFNSKEAGCYYYGWIRCVISDSLKKITIKDYAYNSNCGGGIQAGMLTSSINEPIAAEPIIVVQNEVLHIAVTESYNGSNVFLTNMLGEVINTATISTATTQFNLIGLASGIYLVSLRKDEQTFVKQIMVN